MVCFAICMVLVAALALSFANKRSTYPLPRKFMKMVAAWQQIADESAHVERVALDKVRRKFDWGANLGAFLAKLGDNDQWITAWAADGGWQNYPLMVNDKLLPGQTAILCPTTCALLESVQGISVAGFSRVKAGCRIEPHHDGGAGRSDGLLTLHVCLTGKSVLRVGSEVIQQTPGTVIVFDAEMEHEVWNNNHTDRTLLYINFRTDDQQQLV